MSGWTIGRNVLSCPDLALKYKGQRSNSQAANNPVVVTEAVCKNTVRCASKILVYGQM